MMSKAILDAYELAKKKYAEFGIDTDQVIKKMDDVNVSLHCWQTDDVGGFET
ncbi:MAG: L-rhamnose isomerase, partial [Flavobacteriales bacterium]|nr:L-rhamnose isomerase [Flavobacteriales bacterium]